MEPRDRSLVRDLAIAIVAKLLVLSLLWWWFVRDQQVEVQPADHFVPIAEDLPPSSQFLVTHGA
jgi:hypothetical protein